MRREETGTTGPTVRADPLRWLFPILLLAATALHAAVLIAAWRQPPSPGSGFVMEVLSGDNPYVQMVVDRSFGAAGANTSGGGAIDGGSKARAADAYGEGAGAGMLPGEPGSRAAGDSGANPLMARTKMLELVGSMGAFGAVSAFQPAPSGPQPGLAWDAAPLGPDPAMAAGRLSGTASGNGYGAASAARDPEATSGIHGFGLGDAGQMGHGYGTGDGAAFGRGGGRMERGRGLGRSASAGALRANAAVGPEAIASADEVLVFEAVEAAGAGGGDGPSSPRPAQPTAGTLRAKGPTGAEIGGLPLRRTEVSAEISGQVAGTVVEQRYGNPFDAPIEAVYVFPLPAMAAVTDFVMEVGGRRIVGVVRPREEAERTYLEARARGQTASLLAQERPNVFTQSVANIEPQGEVKVRITYFERLPQADGWRAWVFPMVVGPRYIPGKPLGREARPRASPIGERRGGGGTSPPTDRVPDADRITPPVLPPEQRSGHDIGLAVTLDAGLAVADLEAPTHEVDIAEDGASRRVVRLRAADSIPNRDFVLRWKVAGDETQVGLLAHRGAAGGFVSLLVEPPLDPADADVAPREITFLLDVSGSMTGLPLDLSKAIVRRTLERLRPDDRFNVFHFAAGSGQLWDLPRPGSRENLVAARDYVDLLNAGGGTEMLDGIRRALGARHEPGCVQMFVFLTDGFVGNDEEILKLVREERGDARFFAFGIGSSVNRYLIDGVAKHGGGAAHVVIPRDPEHVRRAVESLFAAIDAPVLVDVAIDWSGLPVEDVYPRQVPDLFAGRSLAVVARYSAPAEGWAYVEGRVGSRSVRIPVHVVLPEREEAHAALASLWARERIEDRSDAWLGADVATQASLRQEITDLAVEFRLASRFTSFVAVDESRVVGDGRPLRILQPVELPEDVDWRGVFGEGWTGSAVDVPGWGLTLQSTESGAVRVAVVAPQGAAERTGIRSGARVQAVGGTQVHDLAHFESLLLQNSGDVWLTLDPGGNVDLPAP
jgi:Ca-activated chloride channel family protein